MRYRKQRRGGKGVRDINTSARNGKVVAVVDVRDGRLVAELRSPLRGVAPGQTMVLYQPDPEGDEVIASATIARADA